MIDDLFEQFILNCPFFDSVQKRDASFNEAINSLNILFKDQFDKLTTIEAFKEEKNKSLNKFTTQPARQNDENS